MRRRIDRIVGKFRELNLVAFSVPKAAYDDTQQAFADTPEGEGTSWKSSYGASGDQARAVMSGLPADYVSFSLSSDMTKLVDKQLVAPDWASGANKGIVSVGCRDRDPQGQPAGHHRLGRPDETGSQDRDTQSGLVRLGAVEHPGCLVTHHGQRRLGAGCDRLSDQVLRQHRELALERARGDERVHQRHGDVLISYENEAIAARQSDAEVDYVVPDTSIKIENPGAVTTGAAESAKKFLGFVTSDAGQKIFAEHGFRPLNASIKPEEVKGANDPSSPSRR